MLRKYVAGAMGAFLWQLTPAWGHYAGGVAHTHSHDGEGDASVIIAPEGHGFHDVGHWEVDNAFIHLDAKVFEHAKELHDAHSDEWQAAHIEEQLGKGDSYKALKRDSCGATTGEFPMVNMEGRGDEDCKCAACVIKGSKFIMGMIMRGVDKKCSMEDIKELSDKHGDSGAVGEWDLDAMSPGKDEKDDTDKDNHHKHWNPEKMRKWFCHAYKSHPEVVLGFLAWNMRPMQSASAWCMGAGICKHHSKTDWKSMALEHASNAHAAEAGGKVVDMNEKHHWLHMGVLPEFLTSAGQSFTSVGHDGAMEDDHYASMKEFYEKEKSAFTKSFTKSFTESFKKSREEEESEKEEKPSKEEIEMAEKQQKIEIQKKEEQSKLEQMEQAEAEQVVQARLLSEEGATGDVVQPHRSWLGKIGSVMHMEKWGKKHGDWHGKGGKMQCKRMKMCMRHAIGWAMKWAVKKTYEMCQKCPAKKVQMMCKWAGAHKKFALGMLIGYVEPWKFALGRCMHRREGEHHGPHHWHRDHHGPHHGHDHEHEHEHDRHGPHHKGGPFTFLSWLPFGEKPQHENESEKGDVAMTHGAVGREGHGQWHGLHHGMRSMRSLLSNLWTRDYHGEAVAKTEREPQHVTESKTVDEDGTTTTREAHGKGFYMKTMSFRRGPA